MLLKDTLSNSTDASMYESEGTCLMLINNGGHNRKRLCTRGRQILQKRVLEMEQSDN